jgi:hypothetical protein
VALAVGFQAALFAWVAASEISSTVYLICYTLLYPAVALLVFLVIANAAAQRWAPRRALSRGEILTIYIMVTCSLPLAGFGLVRFLMPSLAYPRYLAITQDGFWTRWQDFLPRWMTPQDPAAIIGFFQGAPSVPWGAWAAPIAIWSLFFLGLVAAELGLVILLRRQWIVSERLTFPIVYLPLQMTAEGARFLRNRLMWAGFAIPFALESLLAISNLVPTIPALELRGKFFFSSVDRPWSGLGGLVIGYYPIAIGLAYFIPTDVSFSCWFFLLALKFLNVGATALGLDQTGALGRSRLPFKEEQAAGAWIALGLMVLWVGRHHLARAFRLRASDDDRLSRWARWGLIGGLVVTLGFAMAAGLAWWMALGMVAIYLLYIVVAARVRAEVGTQWTFAPVVWTPNYVMINAAGPMRFTENQLVNIANFEGVTVDVRAQPMAGHMEAFKMASATALPAARLVAVIALASVTGLAFAYWSSFSHWYATGALTAKANQYFSIKVALNYSNIQAPIDSHQGPNFVGLGAALWAGAFTVLLAVMRTRFVWWPFHPLGYVLANTLTLTSFWLPYLIANVAKVLVLRYGGAHLYRRSIAFFVGIILGDALSQALWSLAGTLFHFPVYSFLT